MSHFSHIEESKVSEDRVENIEGKTKYNNSHVDALETAERNLVERRLVRKLDRRLLPTIVLIFILNYIDVGFTFLSPTGDCIRIVDIGMAV